MIARFIDQIKNRDSIIGDIINRVKIDHHHHGTSEDLHLAITTIKNARFMQNWFLKFQLPIS